MRSDQIDIGNNLAYRKLDWDQMKTGNPKLIPWESANTTYFGVWFNVAKKPWDDLKVRQAVAKAISTDDLIASNNGGAEITGFIPGFFSDYALPADKIRAKLKQDVEGAKKILAEAGYKPGEIKDELKTSGFYAQDAEVVQQHLQNIGINATVNSVVPGAFTGVVQNKNFNIAAGIIGGSTLLSFFGNALVVTGSSNNYWNFSDVEVDRLAKAQAKELDPVKRKALVSQLEERLWQTLPWVPTVSRTYYYFYSCRAKNMMYVPTGNTANQQIIVHMWLDSAGCNS